MKRTILLAVTAALGLAAAIGYTAKPALAWDIANLPAGYTTQHITATTETCQDSYYIFGYSSTSPQLCTDSPTFQQDVDSFVSSTCPAAICFPPTTTTTAPVTTTAAPTTTAAVPPVTTTTAPVDTTTVTPTCDLACLTARIAALEVNYTALSKRVDAVAKANTASWDAFSLTLASGGTVADAALAARSAGWNAIYAL